MTILPTKFLSHKVTCVSIKGAISLVNLCPQPPLKLNCRAQILSSPLPHKYCIRIWACAGWIRLDFTESWTKDLTHLLDQSTGRTGSSPKWDNAFIQKAAVECRFKQNSVNTQAEPRARAFLVWTEWCNMDRPVRCFKNLQKSYSQLQHLHQGMLNLGRWVTIASYTHYDYYPLINALAWSYRHR